jgi:hypothetical protein
MSTSKPHSILKTQQPLQLTEEQYHALAGDDTGVCRACGHEQGNCEPDARKYRCEACGDRQVYGVEELLTRGEIEFI